MISGHRRTWRQVFGVVAQTVSQEVGVMARAARVDPHPPDVGLAECCTVQLGAALVRGSAWRQTHRRTSLALGSPDDGGVGALRIERGGFLVLWPLRHRVRRHPFSTLPHILCCVFFYHALVSDGASHSAIRADPPTCRPNHALGSARRHGACKTRSSLDVLECGESQNFVHRAVLRLARWARSPFRFPQPNMRLECCRAVGGCDAMSACRLGASTSRNKKAMFKE